MKTIGKAKVVLAVMMVVGGSTLAMAADAEKAIPEKGTWEYSLAMETGNLEPIGTGSLLKCNGSAAPVEETVEIGGVTYRVHVDLQ